MLSLAALFAMVAAASLVGDGVQAHDARAADSAEVHRSLERAQRDFERLRRRFLPFTLAGGPSPCPERVGRFCTWPEDPDADQAEQPPEHERVVAARHELLRQFAAAADRLPADGWITGQRLRYLLEAGRHAEAGTVADTCRASPWWCNALRGLVEHARGEYRTADSLFAFALALAPGDVRCRWTDLSVLLDETAVHSYRRLQCDERGPVNERVWWLADPLWLTPGNERRTAHFARCVYGQIVEGTEVPHGIPWREDNLELLVRYGVPERWGQTRSRGPSGRPSVVGHRASHGRSFMPPGRMLDSLPLVGTEPWPLDRGRESFQPSYAHRFTDLAAETAIFRRDDHAIVVTAVPTESTAIPSGAHRPIGAMHVFFSVGADSVVSAWAVPGDSAVARFALVTPYRPGILSIEMLRAADSVAARSRRWLGLHPPGPVLALSDLLLIRPDSTLPGTLEEAASVTRGSAVFAPGESVSLFWEVYAPPVREPVQATLLIEKRDRSFLRRAAEWLGLAGREHAVALTWTMSWPEPTAAAPDAMTLELPAGQEGTFLLTLMVSTASGATAVSHREIAIGD